MIHLNIDSDLEAEVRRIAVESNRSVGTVASALMRLGLGAKSADLLAMVNKCARPIGRPPVKRGASIAAPVADTRTEAQKTLAVWASLKKKP